MGTAVTVRELELFRLQTKIFPSTYPVMISPNKSNIVTPIELDAISVPCRDSRTEFKRVQVSGLTVNDVCVVSDSLFLLYHQLGRYHRHCCWNMNHLYKLLVSEKNSLEKINFKYLTIGAS